MSDVAFWELASLQQEQVATGKPYFEFLRVATTSAGVYVLPAGSTDPQKPHQQDELYYVIRGLAHMRAGMEDKVVGPGSVIFVAAGVEHRFYDIKEELTLLVFFAPGEK